MITDKALVRDALAIGAAASVIGLSYGAIAVANGLEPWVPIAMSLIVFAGGSQFLAAGLLGVGNPIAAVVGGILINTRHFPFGLAIGGYIGDSLPAKLLGSHILIDESTAFTMAEPDSARKRRSFWMVGGTLFVLWNLGTVAGVLIGNAVGDPETFGLDAAFPAGLLALLLPSLRDSAARTAALVGAVIAVLTTPLLPAGLPVLLSLVGLAAALFIKPGGTR